jgi:hypothetical protein
MNPRSIAVGLLALALVAGMVVMYTSNRREPATVLNPPPDIPALVEGELTRVSDADLLERINRECLRRMYAADCPWGDSPRVLPAKASVIWIISNMEPTLQSRGLVPCAAEGGDNPHAISPTLEQLATAYEGIGLKPLAEVVREAVALSDPDDPALPKIQARYAKLVGNGSQAQLLAFARAHRADLFK